MTRFSIFGSAQPADPMPNEPPRQSAPGPVPAPPQDGANNGRSLAPHDLEAALQLLVERAQYITGATGAALAIAQDDEMVCRASAGTCAPPVGARLQVRSGLTGESVSRKQLLRCDNAESDPRVNLETCRELGIASIVVLPLLSSKGEVRGLFELFSDHAYAFEERDLIALERMAELTRTALDLAEKTAFVIPARPKEEIPVPEQPVTAEPTQPATPPAVPRAPERPVLITQPEPSLPQAVVPEQAEDRKGKLVETPLAASLAPSSQLQPVSQPTETIDMRLATSMLVSPQTPLTPLPAAMQRVQKCASCGFPVSEGRVLCVDCEEKKNREPGAEESMPAEFVPSFGVSASAEPVEESWLANHVNLLAILVLILSIVVAVVVFR